MYSQRKKQNTVTLFIVCALLLAACGSSDPDSGEGMLETAQSLAQTMVAVQLTELAQINPTSTPTATMESAETTEEAKDTPTQATGDEPCLAALLADETIPDDTVLSPGANFQKTWLLTNTGTCTWTEEYGLAFHHGNAMHAVEYTPLAGWVAPGESVFLSLDMIAPFEPGSHIGFWSLLSPNETYFGPSSTDTFWVRITVPGPTPTSKPRDFSESSGGAVRSDGLPDSTIKVGDDVENLTWHGFATFSFGNLSDASTVTSVVLSLGNNYLVDSDPFSVLGCLNVYLSYYGGLDSSDYGNASGTPLWTFCSVGDFSGGAAFGGSEAIQAVQTALTANQIQLAFQFDNQTDVDGVLDMLTLNPTLSVYWYKSN